MATAKVTITLHQTQMQEIRALVARGGGSSVSWFIQNAVSIALDDAAGWRAALQGALEQTGGPLTKEEREWADSLLLASRTKKQPRKSKAA